MAIYFSDADGTVRISPTNVVSVRKPVLVMSTDTPNFIADLDFKYPTNTYTESDLRMYSFSLGNVINPNEAEPGYYLATFGGVDGDDIVMCLACVYDPRLTNLGAVVTVSTDIENISPSLSGDVHANMWRVPVGDVQLGMTSKGLKYE